jgi:hypothetical protein
MRDQWFVSAIAAAISAPAMTMATACWFIIPRPTASSTASSGNLGINLGIGRGASSGAALA